MLNSSSVNDLVKWLRTAVVVSLCLWLWSVAAAQAESVAPAAPLERCLNLDETDLGDDLGMVTRQFFDAELGAVDVPRMVENKWLELGMPNLLTAEVDRATESVRAETGFGRRLTSSFSPAQATELAEQIAGRAFASEAFRSRLETLASEVARDFTGSFGSVAARSATSATECVQTYLGNTYGDAVSAAYGQAVQAQVEATGAETLTGTFRPETAGLRSGLGAASIAGGYVARAVAQRLSTQISRRVAGNISARILGRAGSSVIPVVGWVVGGGLIVWDVADGLIRGPFPTIRRQLAGDDTQRQIQQEIVTSLREDLPSVSAELSAGITNEIFTQWQAFTQNFALVLDLAERNATFRQELEKVPEINLYKLAEVVQTVPESAVLEAAQRGQLRRVAQLPESALEILETSSSIVTVLAWAERAGTRLDDVVDNEIYRYKAPEDFSEQTLAHLLETDNAATIARVAALPKQAMDTLLLQLPTANLNALAAEFGTGDLQTVAWYADALAQEPFNALVTRLLERPSRLETFKPEAVRNAVVGSREPLAAVTMLGGETAFGFLGLDFFTAVNRDLSAIFRGDVRGSLFLAKYELGGLVLVGVIVVFAAAVLIWLLYRLPRLFRRQR